MGNLTKIKDLNCSLLSGAEKNSANGMTYTSAALRVISFEMASSFLSTSFIEPYPVSVAAFENGFEGAPEGADVIEF